MFRIYIKNIEVFIENSPKLKRFVANVYIMIFLEQVPLECAPEVTPKNLESLKQISILAVSIVSNN